jgi:hypothetical protein
MSVAGSMMFDVAVDASDYLYGTVQYTGRCTYASWCDTFPPPGAPGVWCVPALVNGDHKMNHWHFTKKVRINQGINDT